MGHSESTASNEAESTSQSSSNQNIKHFNVIGYDDLAKFQIFTTNYLENKEQKVLNLPNDLLINNILENYISLTSASSVKEVFKNVIIPLFNSNLESETVKVQSAIHYINSLSEQIKMAIKKEAERRKRVNEVVVGVQTQVIDTHIKLPGNQIKVSDILKSEESFQDFINNLDSNINFTNCSPASENRQITNKISKLEKNETNIYKKLKWGIGACEIPAIIDSIVDLVKLSLNNEEKKDNFSFKDVNSFLVSLPFVNYCFAPPKNDILEYEEISVPVEISHTETSLLISNGETLFIMGKNKTVTTYNLSSTIINNENRFKQYVTSEEQNQKRDDVITFSNGKIYIKSFAQPKNSLFTPEPFKRIEEPVRFSISGEFDNIPSMNTVNSTDGKYIYSFNKINNDITIFQIKGNKIIFERLVVPKKSDSSLMSPYDGELFPDDFMNTVLTVANGNVISFIKRMRTRDESTTYFSRHFSLYDGRHLGDSNFIINVSLSAMTYDPWNSCYWGMSEENKNIIKLTSFNGCAPWIIGEEVREVEKLDMNAESKTHDDVSLRLLNILEEHSNFLPQLSFSVSQSNPMYSPIAARFFAPCTNEAIASIVSAIEFFLDLCEKKQEKGVWTEEKYHKILLSFFKLLYYNLFNLDFNISNTDANGLPEEFVHREKVLNLLISILNNDKYKFLHKVAALIISDSMELLYKKNYDKLVEFSIIIQNMKNPDLFLLIMNKIKHLNCFPYCISVVNMNSFIKPIIENYPKINGAQCEFVSAYMRSLCFELVKVLSNTIKEKKYQEIILNSFISFSEIVITTLIKDINEAEDITKVSFPLFDKFIIILNSLSSSQKIVKLEFTQIKDLFAAVINKIHDSGASFEITEKANTLSCIYVCYVSYIKCIFTNENSFESFKQFEHLYQASKFFDIKINNVDDAIESVKSNENNDIISELERTQETERVTRLMDYLYKKVPCKLRRKIREEQRAIERNIYAAFIKQFSLAETTSDLADRLVAGEQPQITLEIKQIMQMVYKIRNSIDYSRQKTHSFDALHKGITNISKKIEENYEAFVKIIKEKTMYLLMINPFIDYFRYNKMNFANELKMIHAFFSPSFTLEEYFNYVEDNNETYNMYRYGIYCFSELIASELTSKSSYIPYLVRFLSKTNVFQQLAKSTILNTKEKTLEDITNDIKEISHITFVLLTAITNDCSLINSYIPLIANIEFSIGIVYPQLIVDSVISFIKVLVQHQDKCEHFKSHVSLLVSVLYAISLIREDFGSSKQYKEFYTAISYCIHIPDSFASYEMYFRPGMNLPFNEDVLTQIVSSYADNYDYLIPFIKVIIRQGNNKIGIIYSVLREISAICSGGKSVLMKNKPTISEKPIEKIKECTTPEILLNICNEFIRLVREILAKKESESGILMNNIFTYIIDRAAGKATVNDMFSVFNDPLLLYGIFAVLSNTFTGLTNSKLIKCQYSTTYLITETDNKESIYKCWKLPITGKSQQVDIPIDSEYTGGEKDVTVSEIFSAYDSLIEVFFNYLKNDNYTSNGIAYYAMNSLKEYCKDPKFIERIVDLQIFNTIPSLTFGDCNREFIKILQGHLAQNDFGFCKPVLNVNKLMYASPSMIKYGNSFIFTDDQIKIQKGTHVFLTNVIQHTKDFCIIIEKNNDTSMFDAGFYHISINEFNSKCLMYSSRQVESIFGKTKKKCAYKLDKIKFVYDSSKKKYFIYDTYGNIICSDELPSSVCFVIIAYPKTDINYKFEYNIIEKYPLKNTVFTRKRKNIPLKAIGTMQSIENMKFITEATEHTEIPVSVYSEERYCDKQVERFNAPFAGGVKIAVYPKVYEKQVADLSVIKMNNESPTVFPRFIRFSGEPTENIHFTVPENAFFVPADRINNTFASSVGPECKLCVNHNSGIVYKDVKKEYVSSEILPPIHPRNYGILPAEICNSFADGYVQQQKKNVLTTIIMQCYSHPSLSVKSNFTKLSPYNEKVLIKNLLFLLTSTEPFNISEEGKSPIDFKLDITDASASHACSNSILQNNAILNICNYISKEENITKFIKVWSTLLINEISDSSSHSIKENHPYGIVIDLSSFIPPFVVTKRDITGWIIVRTGLDAREMDICTIQESGSKSTINITNKITFIDSPTFTITKVHNRDIKLAAIPYIKDSTHTLLGTFFDMMVSFKYLLITISKNKEKINGLLLERIRAKLYCTVIDSFIGNSPYFTTYGKDVFAFLLSALPFECNDFSSSLPKRFAFIPIFKNIDNYKYCISLLKEVQLIMEERSYLMLKLRFPYFLSESDKMLIEGTKEESEFSIPSSAFVPDSLNLGSTNIEELLPRIERLFRNYTDQYKYPFPMIFNQWAKFKQLYPDTEMTMVSKNLMKVKFGEFLPAQIKLNLRNAKGIEVTYAYQENMDGEKNLNTDEFFNTDDHKEIFFKHNGKTQDWSEFEAYISSSSKFPAAEFIIKHKDMFVEDVKTFIFRWNRSADVKLLKTLDINQCSSQKTNVIVSANKIVHEKLEYPLALSCIRCNFLFIINWIYDKAVQNDSLSKYCSEISPFVSQKIKANIFRNILSKSSSGNRPHLEINRKAALEIREGVSHEYSQTIIAQMAGLYSNPANFRNSSDKPWEVHFTNEEGIDAGGPARELVTELAVDACSVNCGLVVPSPNNKNNEGLYRDTVIPIPNPDIKDPEPLYKFVGALIAICSRTLIVQSFNYPPIVWEYILTGEINIERIYEIDEKYKHLIESLKKAQASDISEEEFESQFNISFVITDFSGNIVPITQGGRLEKVTKESCPLFISLANKYRINELQKYLNYIRDGFWENVGIKPLALIDWETLEYTACGEREITFEAIKNTINFEGIPKDQRQMFMRYVEEITSEQRSKLLRFATGRIRLPPNSAITGNKFLQIDSYNGTDIMPTSSTCFHKLHMPHYTSYEILKRMITLAIEYTGTMELG